MIICPKDKADMPPAVEEGSTIREFIWGLDSQASLDALATRLGDDAMEDAEGRLAIRDLDGFTHAFRVTTLTPVTAAGQDVNGPHHHRRIDKRSHNYREVHPIGIGHVVMWANDIEKSAAFFQEKLGFVESDRFIGFGIFLRAATPGPHHHMFLQSRPGKPGADHVAFTVDNHLEVLGGGLAMERKGWPTRLGPGFHPISSAFYWYMESPLGPLIEYYADDDYCTEKWEPGAFPISSEMYTDWAVTGFHKQNRNH